MRHDRTWYIYIMTNPSKTVLYTGITNDIKRRVYEHKTKTKDGFTKKYNAINLVYYEIFDSPLYAIEREKQIKGKSRKAKIALIEAMNKKWNDIFFLL